MDAIRTFIAIELPEEVRDVLARAEQDWRRLVPTAARLVKWADPANIHLTLKFLGETPTAKLPAVQAALEQAARAARPFTLRLAPAGCFPNTRQPRVLWIGVNGDTEALARLQSLVEAQVSPLGFPSESRRFSAHLTLGRVRDDASPDARQRLGEAAQALHVAPASFTAATISLMRSDLRPEGAIYTRLFETILGGTRGAL